MAFDSSQTTQTIPIPNPYVLTCSIYYFLIVHNDFLMFSLRFGWACNRTAVDAGRGSKGGNDTKNEAQIFVLKDRVSMSRAV